MVYYSDNNYTTWASGSTGYMLELDVEMDIIDMVFDKDGTPLIIFDL